MVSKIELKFNTILLNKNEGVTLEKVRLDMYTPGYLHSMHLYNPDDFKLTAYDNYKYETVLKFKSKIY